MKIQLKDVLTLYSEKNIDNKYVPVAVGKYGIRLRSEIYKKELSKDYSRNKVIRNNTLIIGMGSTQIDFGVLSENKVYSVSPAYYTYKIDDSIVQSKYLEYLLISKNSVYTKKYMIPSARQGKKVDRERLLEEFIDVPSIDVQRIIIDRLNTIKELIKVADNRLSSYDELAKARFVEMFGDAKSNPYGFEKRPLKETCTVITGNTPSRSVSEYYGDSIEWIKTDNIVAGQLNPSQALEYLSDEGVKVGRTVEKGAILMVCIAGSIASIGRVCITDRKVAFNQQINAIVPKDYDSLFLHAMLQLSKEYLVEEINMALKGILSKSKLEGKEFIVPPIDQQKQFAAFVAQIDKSKVTCTKAKEYYEELLSKLMSESFN